MIRWWRGALHLFGCDSGSPVNPMLPPDESACTVRHSVSLGSRFCIAAGVWTSTHGYPAAWLFFVAGALLTTGYWRNASVWLAWRALSAAATWTECSAWSRQRLHLDAIAKARAMSPPPSVETVLVELERALGSS